MAIETVVNIRDIADSLNHFLSGRGRTATNRATDIRTVRQLLNILRNTPPSSAAPKNIWSTVMHNSVDAFLIEINGGASASPTDRTNLSNLINELRTEGLDPQANSLSNLLLGSPAPGALNNIFLAIAFVGRRNSVNKNLETIFEQISNSGDFSHIRFMMVDEEVSSRVQIDDIRANLVNELSFPSIAFVIINNPVAGPGILSTARLDRFMRYYDIKKETIERYLKANMKKR
jgi:hypothetical protein